MFSLFSIFYIGYLGNFYIQNVFIYMYRESIKKKARKIMAVNGVHGTQGQPQRIEKKYDEKTGELRSISIFKDVNGDGKEDLYKVTVFSKTSDGSTHERTVIDNDGDGYNDYQRDIKYNKNGKKTEEKEFYEEDINKIKNRNHLEYEIYNRKMTTHESGYYMM